MLELLQFTFMQRALIAATLTGAVCAVIGVYVVLRGMSFIGAGISHASFGGVALGFFLRINPFHTAVVFCLLVAWLIGWVSERQRLREDAAVGIFFASTMAFGVLLVGLLKGVQIDLFGYLFGNILAISSTELLSMVVLALVVFTVIVFFYKELLLLTFDAEMAAVIGLSVRGFNFIFLTLLALTIVLSIKAVGIVLVSALLVIPAASAAQLTDRFRNMMIVSVVFGVVSCWVGLFLSAVLDIASGATIVLTATFFFFVSMLISPQRKKMRMRIGKLQKQSPEEYQESNPY
ncbi:MAG TPA: metal ABC transporter permease [bacterium]|nr:metal ABC transporter permease [bacterium]HNT66491.1 metal ABC transporter permease [bacterium]